MMQQPNSRQQQQGLLEDLLTPIKQSLTTFPNGGDPGLFWETSYNEEDDSLLASSSSSSFLQLISSSIEPTFQCSSYTGETVDFSTVLPNLDSFTPGNVSNSSSYGQQVREYKYEYEYDDKLRSMVSVQEGYPNPTMVIQEDANDFNDDDDDDDDKIHEEHQKVVFRSGEKKSKSKKVEGQPSKNLMAERRRRKRLNDRLSMLRSIVPRISKMMQQPNSRQQQQGLLEDLLTPIKQSLTTFPNGGDPGLFWETSYNEEDDSLLASSSSSSFLQLISSSIEPTFQCSSYTGETVDFSSVLPNLDSFTPGNVSNSSSYGQQVCEYKYEYEYDDKLRSMVSIQEGYPNPTMVTQEDANDVNDDDDKIHEHQKVVFRSGEKKSKSKKVEGQPSKNLMAERRRRKRLNDRLSMLRSIVPRISKMDRTSILGDTIEYMKDLLEKIHNFKDQDMGSDFNSLNLMGNFKDSKTNEVQARNPPKFEVEKRNIDTRIQICCSSKPGLLVSTVNTLEPLGLDIQQCVISSFSDFSVHASCSEAQENRAITSSEDIKQILFRNAGYVGRCL